MGAGDHSATRSRRFAIGMVALLCACGGGGQGGATAPRADTQPNDSLRQSADTQIDSAVAATPDAASRRMDALTADAPLTDATMTDAATGDATMTDTTTSDATTITDAATNDTADVKLGPPYPIVLAHGFFGTDKFAGLNFATYFFGVKADLNKIGEVNVFTPAVDPFNTSIVRGKALLAHVKAILAKTGHAKVNLIGHSQGGLDARYVASVAPELVASVITVATPHYGSPAADILLKLVPFPGVQAMIDALAKLIGKPIYTANGEGSSVITALKQFSPAQAKLFNAAYPNAPGVSYYSVAGRSDHTLALKVCTPDEAHDFVLKLKYNTDPIDPLLALTEAAIDGSLFNVKPNDGLVRVEDAKWGVFLGCVPADHMDEVGQIFGDKPGLFNPFNHKAMYRWLVKMLRLKGM